MQYHPDRPTAIKAARAAGWGMFDTKYEPGKGHYASMAGGPIAEWAAVWAERYMVVPGVSKPDAFVVHVGHRDNKPLIRITCPRDEVEHLNIPDAFIVEPYCESMLSDDVHTGPRERAAGGGGGTRERTSVAGAVGIVHAICDDLHKAGAFDRKVAVAKAIEAGIHASTANTQVYRWRKNNGM